MKVLRLGLVAATMLGCLHAQEPTAPVESTPAPVMVAVPVTLAANAAVPMRFLSTVSSATYVRGQKFELEVTDDIRVGERIVIPAGTIAVGEVVHADRARGLGKAGELIVSARYVTVGSRQIKLRGQLSMTGRDKTMQAFFLVPWIKGKNLEVAADTEVIGRTVADEVF